MKILITGATGGLARLLSHSLASSHEVVGIDPRPTRRGDIPFPGEFLLGNYTQRKVEDLFRHSKFDAIYHMGRIMVTSGIETNERYTLNVLGTRNILNLAKKYEVPSVIVLSTYHVYGAHPGNHLYINEDEPLRASQSFLELSDAIELDHYAKTFSLQYPDVRTLILRPVNIVGPNIRNTISNLLRSKLCPKLLGYDPMMQFLHEHDAVRAMRFCLGSQRSGVYNIAGEGMLPYGQAIENAGAVAMPIPHFVAYPFVSTFVDRNRFPRHLMDYFRYSTIVSDSSFRKDFDFTPEITVVDTIRSLRT